MEDHRLKSYCLVVETKSFSRAAQAKRMTQSAMSRLVKNLEDELGVQLLRREGKAATPTPAGKLFYDQAKKILEQYREMENSINGLIHRVNGPLSIGVSKTPAAYLLPQLLYTFSRAYPDIGLEITVSNTEQIILGLRKGAVDIGIVDGSVNDHNISAEKIAGDEIVIISAEDNPLAGKNKISLQDLASQPFIMPEPGSGAREIVDIFFREQGIAAKNVNVHMTIGSPELIVQMVQAGMGIAFVSKWSVFKAVKEGTLKLLKFSNKKLVRHFYLVSIDKGAASLAVRTFRAFVKEYKFFIPF